MKYFVDGNGKIIDVNGADHVAYAKRVLKSTLKAELKKFVRVQIFNRTMGFETTQVRLSDSQRTSLGRLFRQHSCIAYVGRVRSLAHASPDQDCVTRINWKKFGV